MTTDKLEWEEEDLGCGLVITGCKVHLNPNPLPMPGRDRRVATVNITINDALIINNIKVTEDAVKSWSLELPSMMVKNDANPSGKKFFNVMLAHEQLDILRRYCFIRIGKAQKESGFSKPAVEPTAQ
ncbi:MAG: hypothetical protein RL318_1943 [Fibrobacterota bacterium]|jgi:hypothetical protein